MSDRRGSAADTLRGAPWGEPHGGAAKPPPGAGTLRLRVLADSLCYADADLHHVRGHRQVTDSYLASLVGSRPDAKLATLDEGLVRPRPELTLLVPIS